MDGSKGGEIPHLAPALPSALLPLSQPESPPFLYRWALLCCVKKGYCRATREGGKKRAQIFCSSLSSKFSVQNVALSTVGPSCSPVHHSSVAAWKNMIHHLVPSDRRIVGRVIGVRGILGRKKAAPLTRTKVGRQKSYQPLFEGQSSKGDENLLILDELKETGQAIVDSL